MVLRRPYAFLIKYFKLIHLGILFLIGFIFYKTSDLMSFYSDYIKANFRTTETLFADGYFDFSVIGAFFLLLALAITIFLLMRFKKKNTLYYLSTIIFYGVLFIIFFMIHGNLMELERSSVDSATVLIYRDIINLIFYPQFIFIFMTVLKAIGFDIKTFSFVSEFDELELSEEDNEEVDVSVKVDNYKVFRKFRRVVRELRYYVLENKFIFSIIVLILLLVFTVSLFMNYQVYNKNYSEGKEFVYGDYNLIFKDSYITKYDYKGDLISGDYYLAVIVNATNISTENNKIDSDAFKIRIEDEYIEPILDMSGKFIDMGIPYYGVNMLPNKSEDYVFVYNLGDEIESTYTISILDSYELVDDELVTKYKHVNIIPSVIVEESVLELYDLGDKVVFNEDFMLDSYMVINEYELSSTYNYTYDFCYNDECSESKGLLINDTSILPNSTLLVLDAELLLDEDSLFLRNNKGDDFFEEFINIKYIDNGKEVMSDVIDVTPEVLKDKIIFQVTNKVNNSDTIELVVNIRGHKHTIVLKG